MRKRRNSAVECFASRNGYLKSTSSLFSVLPASPYTSEPDVAHSAVPLRWYVAIYGFSFVVRLVFILFGDWQDSTLTVKYTDVDYRVFTDAAALLWEGQSPYQRHTYRYTPLMAYVLVPNAILHRSFGKVLFCCMDLICGYLIELILAATSGKTRQSCLLLSCLWLLNPVVVAVSTRGSADTFPCMLVLLFIYLMTSGSYLSAAVTLGFAVHLKIFPIIYSIPALFAINPDHFSTKAWHRILVAVDDNCKGPRTKSNSSARTDSTALSNKRTSSQVLRCWRFLVCISWEAIANLNRKQWIFGIVSAASFILPCLAFYTIYGYQFLHETYLHHFSRQDHRHNFSFFFYLMYLTSMDSTTFTSTVTFWPQLLTTLAVGLAYCRKRFPFGCFLQTVLFVALNKVCTAQYFLWWMSLLPLAIGYLRFTKNNVAVFVSSLAFFYISQLHWLFWAYRLEFLGQSVYLQLLFASAVLLLSQITLACGFIYLHEKSGWRTEPVSE
eukprot:GHVS01019262.1.p1 GENE.GHVS01019262.1~~GHVS01019262.1.p1  ORF type:complete len:497 (+),score=14.34 GHVS01019262.1:80-1570(+)